MSGAVRLTFNLDKSSGKLMVAIRAFAGSADAGRPQFHRTMHSGVQGRCERAHPLYPARHFSRRTSSKEKLRPVAPAPICGQQNGQMRD
jgi:hypothetical protein